MQRRTQLTLSKWTSKYGLDTNWFLLYFWYIKNNKNSSMTKQNSLKKEWLIYNMRLGKYKGDFYDQMKKSLFFYNHNLKYI